MEYEAWAQILLGCWSLRGRICYPVGSLGQSPYGKYLCLVVGGNVDEVALCYFYSVLGLTEQMPTLSVCLCREHCHPKLAHCTTSNQYLSLTITCEVPHPSQWFTWNSWKSCICKKTTFRETLTFCVWLGWSFSRVTAGRGEESLAVVVQAVDIMPTTTSPLARW